MDKLLVMQLKKTSFCFEILWGKVKKPEKVDLNLFQELKKDGDLGRLDPVL